jgi:hypothetical protein
MPATSSRAWLQVVASMFVCRMRTASTRPAAITRASPTPAARTWSWASRDRRRSVRIAPRASSPAPVRMTGPGPGGHGAQQAAGGHGGADDQEGQDPGGAAARCG